MLSTVEVTIAKIKTDKVILELPNGQKIEWPKAELPQDLATGDSWQLILTSSQNLLNEILNVEQQEKGQTAVQS